MSETYQTVFLEMLYFVYFFLDDVIGVHCTHGLNRTGFFICKYMIEKLHYYPAQAIDCKFILHIIFVCKVVDLR